MSTVDGRSRRAEYQREQRKNAILSAALGVFSEQGYHAASISQIVKEAGVARGTFYQYFDSKKDIFVLLLNTLISELRGSIVGVDQGPNAAPLRQQLDQTVTRIFTVVNTNRSITRLVFREAVGLDEEVEGLLKAFYNELQTYVMAALSVGHSLGAIRSLDREVVAQCIVGSLRQVAQHYLIDNPESPFDPEHIAKEVVMLYLGGVLTNS
jgi:TetR/AcrR family fatty acid metabolism transcriptional regulator